MGEADGEADDKGKEEGGGDGDDDDPGAPAEALAPRLLGAAARLVEVGVFLRVKGRRRRRWRRRSCGDGFAAWNGRRGGVSRGIVIWRGHGAAVVIFVLWWWRLIVVGRRVL